MVRKASVWVMATVCLVSAFCSCAWAKYGGGNGTAAKPYLIYSAEHLKEMADHYGDWGHDVYWKLMADINLASSTVVLKPIGTWDRQFEGNIDGNGKTISHLQMTVTSGDYVGLFGYAAADIHDVTLTDVRIEAPQSTYVGALAGGSTRPVKRCHVVGGTVVGLNNVGGLMGTNIGVVSRCHTTCSVSGGDGVGGLLGWNRGVEAANQCFASGSVTGQQRVGGLVGRNTRALRDCYATGAVSANMSVGGLVGSGEAMEGPIWNCYARGKVSCTGPWSGGLAGMSALCFSCYWEAGSTTASSPYGLAKTTAQMRSAATFRGWGRGAAWTIAEGVDYPRLAWENRPSVPLATPAFPGNEGKGTAQSPYVIHTPDEFNAIGEFPGEWGAYYRLEADIDLAPLGTTCRNIGGEHARFTGTFDGAGHTIANFTCPTSIYYQHAGLFGYAYGATIKGLTLVNPRVESRAWVSAGPLAGVVYGGTVEKCGVQGGVVTGTLDIGGLVGVCSSATITQCYSTCQVAGWLSSQRIGGLVGRGERCNVSESYAAGRVQGDLYIGGFMGRLNSGSVSHCYSCGLTTGRPDAGGLIGTADKSSVSACFWDTLTSGCQLSAGGTGLTTTDMQTAATYVLAGWDFVGETANGTASIWCIEEGKGYPQFYQAPATPETPTTPETPVTPPQTWADDFEDGNAAPLWEAYQPYPDLVSLAEANGRLEVRTQGGVTAQTALYVAKGWSLDPNTDFYLKVNFRLEESDKGEGWVFIGLTPNPAEPLRYRVEMKAGDAGGGCVYGGVLTEEIGMAQWSAVRYSDMGTLYISYNVAKDELYRSFTGYGPANAWNTVTGLVKNRWKGKPLYVFLGGSFTDMPLADGSAWLDNFVVDSGSVSAQ